MKAKKKIIWFFLLLFVCILLSILCLNRLNKHRIKAEFAEITFAQGMTIRHLLEVSGLYLAEEGVDKLTVFLDRLFRNDSIIYIGLFEADELTYLLSRYEGFFPVVTGQHRHRILQTPIGKVFEISARFSKGDNKKYRLYIGFDYEFLTTVEHTMGQSFLLVMVLFSFLMLAVTALVFYFDKKFYRKELELVRETQEKERFKELSMLTSEIAHEIKNPLNSIYLSFNTLEKHCSQDEESLFYRDAIKGEIRRVSEILQSYSELSKEVRPHRGEVNIDAFVGAFRFLTHKEVENNKAELLLETTGEPVFYTDENLLKQILLNLFNNALESGATEIRVCFKIGTEALTLTVKDNGKGIAESMREDIFKPYISGKTKGMGLGLHISRRIVNALDGDLSLVSAQPGATCFKVMVPKV
ncbi:MAG: HAMP domain-containing histidine kinase [bacterium]|nr:HAMP domain-containing histidine kinase [bacterium]